MALNSINHIIVIHEFKVLYFLRVACLGSHKNVQSHVVFHGKRITFIAEWRAALGSGSGSRKHACFIKAFLKTPKIWQILQKSFDLTVSAKTQCCKDCEKKTEKNILSRKITTSTKHTKAYIMLPIFVLLTFTVHSIIQMKSLANSNPWYIFKLSIWKNQAIALKNPVSNIKHRSEREIGRKTKAVLTFLWTFETKPI